MRSQLLEAVDRYYSAKVVAQGATPAGADWKDRASQELRFEQLMKIRRSPGPFTLNDFGCGWGALYAYLSGKTHDFRYHGVDISAPMIASARRLHGRVAPGRFELGGESRLRRSDYTVASGVFNVRLGFGRRRWEAYVLRSIRALWRKSRRGLAFNLLSLYSDRPKRREDLYYADPLFYFHHCKTGLSKNVSLLHDYGLYEFTVLVRR